MRIIHCTQKLIKELLDNIRILEMNKERNRTILKGIKYLHPIEALRDLSHMEPRG